MWIEKIRSLAPEAQFTDPASQEAIAACESALAVELDLDLATLLRESNGVTDGWREQAHGTLGAAGTGRARRSGWA